MKINIILENDVISRDTSTLARIALQIASNAAIKFKGDRARKLAHEGANRAHSMMLQAIDAYFDEQNIKKIN